MNIDPFTKNIALPIIFHMPHDDLSICFRGWAILVYVQDHFWQFLFKVVQTGFCSASEQLNLQIKKKILSLPSSRFPDKIFLLPLIWWCLPRWMTHGGRHKCKTEFKKIVSQNLDEGNVPRFFLHWRILLKLQLWLLLVDFKNILSFHVVRTKIFVWPSQIFWVFSSTFQHHDKVV